MTTLLNRLKSWARRIRRDGITLWFALRHPTTPLAIKALAGVIVAYALSPIDLIPDFIPVLGYLDELILLPGLIWLALRLLPAPVVADARAQADAWQRDGAASPQSRIAAAVIIALWLAAAVALGLWVGQWVQPLRPRA